MGVPGGYYAVKFCRQPAQMVPFMVHSTAFDGNMRGKKASKAIRNSLPAFALSSPVPGEHADHEPPKEKYRERIDNVEHVRFRQQRVPARRATQPRLKDRNVMDELVGTKGKGSQHGRGGDPGLRRLLEKPFRVAVEGVVELERPVPVPGEDPARGQHHSRQTGGAEQGTEVVHEFVLHVPGDDLIREVRLVQPDGRLQRDDFSRRIERLRGALERFGCGHDRLDDEIVEGVAGECVYE